MITKISIAVFSCFSIACFSQNIGINTDGSAAETGVMLDVKGTNAITTTATQNVFQVKSFNASGAELKMRMILGTHATAGSRYAGLEVYDAGAAAYRNLALQPSGGNVGIGTTAPASLFHVDGATRLGTASTTSGSLIFNQSASANAITIQPQAGALAAAYTLTLPPDDGTAGQVLSTNGSGVLTWATDANAGGDITDVTAGAGLTGGGAGPGAVTVTAAADNGLNVDAGQDKIQLGGALTEATTITQGAFAFTMNNSGAANTTINLSSTGDLDIQDNGTSALFVKDDGKVGVGTNAPDTKLHVAGTSGTTLKIVDGNQASGKILTSDASGVASWSALSSVPGACMQNVWSYAAAGTYTFTTSASTTKIFVQLWGGGGGGTPGGAGPHYGGGGGGGYAAAYVTVTPSTNYVVVVGGGGAANANGTSSTFNSTVLIAGGGIKGAQGSCCGRGGAGGTASTTLGAGNAILLAGQTGGDYEFYDGSSSLFNGEGGDAAGGGGRGGKPYRIGTSPGGGGGCLEAAAAGAAIIMW